jgi:hypothetical protein
MQRVHATSVALAAVLILSLLSNGTWLAISHLGIIDVPRLSLIFGINSLVSCLSVGIWALHHWQLTGHLRAVQWHLPGHPDNPLHLHLR